MSSSNPEIFRGVQVDANGHLLPQTPSKRRLEVLGDSVSAAYGIYTSEEQQRTCYDDWRTQEDSWASYGRQVALKLNGQCLYPAFPPSLIFP